MTARLLLTAGALLAALGVALGAFGAHALRARLSERMLAVWETAVQYQLVHALGLMAVGLLMLQLGQGGLLRWSGGLMLAGVVLFSGSLYLMCLGGPRWLGPVTPLGGVAFIAAWLLLALVVWRAV
ncbi:DUF423 domain-containing protein [Alkalilimnicola sp. S0819]|uniref:DUF423 domain-containing protein n=1 Tax=Alkalilimnicola sp. S0819 TaxID=2613922 RepID=UPI0012621ACD|nr:DUF423 domain-containing protein [Alkalilimnicola sp. S0819]KAB7627814.1 DUF423 domain-containing protein [Alkalilimnicola sp. S0819]MPQ15445.1 DUF423 domain-containing protein [Alkalilimnicola sp. S0819]